MVHINGSHTTSTRIALNHNIQGQINIAQSIATGKAIVDATGLALGSALDGNARTMEIIQVGIQQSQGMLNIAEKDIIAYYEVFTRLEQIAARGFTGAHNDDAKRAYISPAYKKEKLELQRIANSSEFNGTYLLNGSKQNGAQVTAPVKSQFTLGEPNYSRSRILKADLINSQTAAIIDAAFDKISGVAVTSSKLLSNDDSTIEFILSSDSTFKYDALNNKTTVSNVTLVYHDLSYEATATTPTRILTGKTDVSIPKVSIKIDGFIDVGSKDLTGKIALDTTTALNTTDNLPIFSKSVDSNNKVTTVVQETAVAPSITAIPTTGASSVTENGNVTLTDIERTNKLANGQVGYTSIQLVTNKDLRSDILELKFPNLDLTSLLSALNTDKFIGSTNPTSLSDLETERDAQVDIPLIQAAIRQLIVLQGESKTQRDNLNTIIEQLETRISATQSASDDVLAADPANLIAKSSNLRVKTQMALEMLKRLNQITESMAQLVQ